MDLWSRTLIQIWQCKFGLVNVTAGINLSVSDHPIPCPHIQQHLERAYVLLQCQLILTVAYSTIKKPTLQYIKKYLVNKIFTTLEGEFTDVSNDVKRRTIKKYLDMINLTDF